MEHICCHGDAFQLSQGYGAPPDTLALKSPTSLKAHATLKVHREKFISRSIRRYIVRIHTQNYQEWKFRLCSSSASPSIIQRCVLICYSRKFLPGSYFLVPQQFLFLFYFLLRNFSRYTYKTNVEKTAHRHLFHVSNAFKVCVCFNISTVYIITRVF